MVSAILRFTILLVASAVAIGCTDRQPTQAVTRRIDVATVVRGHQHLRQQTQRRFAQASFLSPQPDSDAGIPLWMAPLLVHEYSTASADESPWARFGAVIVDSTGRALVDCDDPTVYLLSAEIMVGSQSLKQLTYWWFYPPVAIGQPIRFRGFRMTLGDRGYGVVWDVVSSDSDDRIFYVSKPVEQAAANQHGEPLPGRRYAVEPPVEEYPEVVVPRVIGDGPQPMGPFVYLDAASLAATTLICRCEPSQVDKFPHSSHYRLQRIDAPRDLYGGDSPPTNLPLPTAHASPEDVLRLPDQL
jgi:hypothetical protein